ncbi:UNVERIFIED_CONTAM: putative copper-transporting ATPase HMA5 [Sesamum calycinum]|uniref:Copper-transporting ATPase HMA5 n=1 Tax=Sesamum calycinum TaxID=2727403 RepID=A0AAW2JDK0_9LAMI
MQGRTTAGICPPAHYPSMPKYPKGVSVSSDEEKFVQGSESKALFSVTGMTCSACAGSVEKAVKRLPGIKEAVVDVLNNRAQVTFYPAFVNLLCLSIGVSADLINGELEK